jgi:hypothetical protein
MAPLPQPTIDAIYAAYKAREKPRHSSRLGASMIGKECDRRLWMGFRHVFLERFDGRMLRLFDTGHREELRVIDDLRAAGMEVWALDPATSEQYTYTALDGHVVAKLDGVVLGVPEAPETPHDLSIKTANTKNFAKIQKDGIAKAKPEHYAQVQIEMGLADLNRALYVCVCKDTDEIYVERINFDDKAFKAFLLRASRIIKAEAAPDRISNDPAFYICKFCPLTQHCHGEAMPEVNCRTCVHATPGANGTWQCANDLEMKPGCNDHLFVPDLLPWAEPVEGDPTWIRYRVKSTGKEFINCSASGFPAIDVPHYESAELVNMKPIAIGNEAVESVRTILDGRVEATR